MAEKQTAGLDYLVKLAPKFAELNDTSCLGKFDQEKTNCRRETGAWLLLRRCFPQACTRNWRPTWSWAKSMGSPRKKQWRLLLSLLSTAASLRRGALSLWLKKSTGTKSEYTKRSSDHMGEWRSLFLQFTCSGKGWRSTYCCMPRQSVDIHILFRP